jgi:dihydroorotate dehydrogenase electron transfer subunit
LSKFLLPWKTLSDIFLNDILIQNMRKDSLARITRKESWNNYFLLSFESPEIVQEAEPGQFLMVRIRTDTPPLLRRPFSLFSAEDKIGEIFFQITGLGTRLLSEKREGDFIDIIGPLGKGFTVDKDIHQIPFALIGGGRGIAPLYFLAQKLSRAGGVVRVYYGGKSIDDLPVRERFSTVDVSLTCTTEDGSMGTQGQITEIFEADLDKDLSVSRIYACGPELMLRKIAELAAAQAIPAEISLESMMGCGFGACWGCVKKIRENEGIGWHKICEEGPVLKAEDVFWE